MDAPLAVRRGTGSEAGFGGMPFQSACLPGPCRQAHWNDTAAPRQPDSDCSVHRRVDRWIRRL